MQARIMCFFAILVFVLSNANAVIPKEDFKLVVQSSNIFEENSIVKVGNELLGLRRSDGNIFRFKMDENLFEEVKSQSKNFESASDSKDCNKMYIEITRSASAQSETFCIFAKNNNNLKLLQRIRQIFSISIISKN